MDGPLDSQLQIYQILTNDDQMFILCLSYFIATVPVVDIPCCSENDD